MQLNEIEQSAIEIDENSGNAMYPNSYFAFLSNPFNPYFQLAQYMFPSQHMSQFMPQMRFPEQPIIIPFPTAGKFISAMTDGGSVPAFQQEEIRSSIDSEVDAEEEILEVSTEVLKVAPTIEVPNTESTLAEVSDHPTLQSICAHLRSITNHPELLNVCEKALAESIVSISLEDLEAHIPSKASSEAPKNEAPSEPTTPATPETKSTDSIVIPAKQMQEIGQLDQYFISKIQELTRTGQLTGLSISIEYEGNNAVITFNKK